MKRSRIRGVIALAALPILGACDLGEQCLGISVRVEPESATIDVGETFTARALEETCDGNVLGPVDAKWVSSDTLVARVDSVLGLVTGVGEGVTEIVALTQGVSMGEVAVEVQAP